MSQVWRLARDVYARQRNVPLDDLPHGCPDVTTQLRLSRKFGDGVTGGNRPEVSLHELEGAVAFEVAADREHGVVRDVEGAEELVDVFERCGVDVFYGANDGVVVRVARRVDHRL